MHPEDTTTVCLPAWKVVRWRVGRGRRRHRLTGLVLYVAERRRQRTAEDSTDAAAFEVVDSHREDCIVHILTKIFIVLVSLLAVLLVPLVIAYASNENTYKSRWQDSVSEARAAQASLSNAESRHASIEASMKAEQAQAEEQIRRLRAETSELRASIRQVQSELTIARAEKLNVTASLETLAAALKGNQDVNSTLLADLKAIRQQAINDALRVVELDEALRDVTSQLDVEVAARRSLQEEVQRIRDERAALYERNQQYVAQFGELRETDVRAGDRGIAPDINLEATVLNVRRSEDETLVEINVGSRDGVQIGWSMFIGSGSDFIANLRIIEVDISTAVGVVTLENPSTRGRVQVGHTAFARRGEM